jgi:hypothetical protein
MTVSTTNPLHHDTLNRERRGLGHLLLRMGMALVRLSRTNNTVNATYEPCQDPAILESLRALRAQDIAATGGFGFDEWMAVRMSSTRRSAARERRDMTALGELVADEDGDTLRVYGLLMRSADRLTITSLSSLTVKFWSVMANGRLIINSSMTLHGHAAWTRQLSAIGLSRREIDRALPLRDIDDFVGNISRRESVKPLAQVWNEHRALLAAETQRGNPPLTIEAFNTYAACARRERAHA